eukprot:COSAG05_NODE_1779_length_4104_cov_5.080020_1_plen_35_part_00
MNNARLEQLLASNARMLAGGGLEAEAAMVPYEYY